MKRHPSLAHLSRDHHGALLLARLLQKNAPVYKGLPADISGKVKYAEQFYKAELIPHFLAEEKALDLVTGINKSLDLLVQTILLEHKELHHRFTNIPTGTYLELYLDATGKALETHIRKEERELFPLMQEICSEALLQGINDCLTQQHPAIKNDIETRRDIERLVNIFYEKIAADQLLGYIFNDVAKVHWEKHLPVMYDFWENIILFTGTYQGNPMNLHRHLHHITPLNESHFQQWNELFVTTVNELFEGKNAALAKQKAISISNIIKDKLTQSRQGTGNIY